MQPRRTNPLAATENEVPMISWAEAVPDAPYPMSDEEFERWPEEGGWQYELIRGRLVRMPGSGGNSYRASRLNSRLLPYVEERGLGYVLGEQGFFRITLPGETESITAAPDVSFTATSHAPLRGSRAFEKPWNTVPDLAVEYVSGRQDLSKKIHFWLTAGVRLLWVLYPREYRAEVWRPSEPAAPVEQLGLSEYLDALEVVPGFRVLVRDVL